HPATKSCRIAGAVPALYRQLHRWHTAPGSARASLLDSKGDHFPGGANATLHKDGARLFFPAD
ncbi:MAG: hypothetical protein KDK75_05330, partial [Alphaproteobacteria bacterium]|nr:hypothetical protein [Alphaproteobacteria bacterium]